MYHRKRRSSFKRKTRRVRKYGVDRGGIRL